MLVEIINREEGGKPPGVKRLSLNTRWELELRSITTNLRQPKVANRLLSESGANWDGVSVRLTASAVLARRKLPLRMRREMANLEAGTKPTCRRCRHGPPPGYINHTCPALPLSIRPPPSRPPDSSSHRSGFSSLTVYRVRSGIGGATPGQRIKTSAPRSGRPGSVDTVGRGAGLFVALGTSTCSCGEANCTEASMWDDACLRPLLCPVVVVCTGHMEYA